MTKLSPEMQEYRRTLQTLEQKSQESYDRTVISLSGGALGISFALVAAMVDKWPPNGPYWLFAAWGAWTFSVSAVLFSFMCSQRALRKAVEQVDAHSADSARLGGRFDRLTCILNGIAGLLFLGGVLAIGVFAISNIGAQ